jgi:hypothetical protein
VLFCRVLICVVRCFVGKFGLLLRAYFAANAFVRENVLFPVHQCQLRANDSTNREWLHFRLVCAHLLFGNDYFQHCCLMVRRVVLLLFVSFVPGATGAVRVQGPDLGLPSYFFAFTRGKLSASVSRVSMRGCSWRNLLFWLFACAPVRVPSRTVFAVLFD